MMTNIWNFKAETGREGRVIGSDAQEAAEVAWEAMCKYNPENYRGGHVEVWKDGEPRKKFVVEVESLPVFHASPVES